MKPLSESRSIAVLSMALVALTLLFSAPVYSQVVGASLSGSVTDASGARVPNASISIKNVATDETRDVTSDTAGFYAAPNLLPGVYEISVSAPGFSTEVRTGITLTVGAEQELNFTMRVGHVTEKVEVTGEAPTVQLATSTVQGEVNATTIRELPLNGRSWTDLAALQPGINTIQNQLLTTDPSRAKRGIGSELTIVGQRPIQNNYRLDGVNVQDYSNTGLGGVLGVSLGIDAIQEFSVLSSDYSAEYGRTSGGVVNSTTRSGTNQFHGTAYWFLRDQKFDARNFFNYETAQTPYRTPPFHRDQAGASGGGPIQKDKTFIFADYESVHQALGAALDITVPSAAAWTGHLCSVPVPSCTPTVVTPNPSAEAYKPLYPLPNLPLNPGGDSGPFVASQDQRVNENFFTTRVDHRISDKDSMFGTYLYDKSQLTSPDSFLNVLTSTVSTRNVGILEETHLFSPRLVNSVRVAFNRAADNTVNSIAAINPAAAFGYGLGVEPGLPAADVAIGGLTEEPGGIGGNNHVTYYWNSFQAYDDAFLTRGTHSLKFGGNVERMQLNNQNFGQADGTYQFGSFEAFLLNEPTSYKTMTQFGPWDSIIGQTAMNGFRQTLAGGYVQDDWRFRPNLTLNLGLRYEPATVMYDIHSRISHLDSFTSTNMILGPGGAAQSTTPIIPPYSIGVGPLTPNATLRNFEPRVGFAWDPFKTGKTAVRGGFGIYDILPLADQWFTQHQTDTPVDLRGSIQTAAPLAGTFYTGSQALIFAQGISSSQMQYVDQGARRNYVMNWNLNVQRELTPNVTAFVGYVGSRGVHMNLFISDCNTVLPTYTAAGAFWPNPHDSGIRLNPNFTKDGCWIQSGHSLYDGLLTSITKRMSHGLQVQGSFTWGKAIDDMSNMTANQSFQNSISSVQWYDLGMSRALADFDIGRTLVINGIWNVPEWRSGPGYARKITNGWQFGGLFKAEDGFPFPATLGGGGDPLGQETLDPWDYPERLTGPGCNSLVNPGNPNHYIKTQCFAAPTVAYVEAAGVSPSLCDTTIGQPGQCLNLRGNSGRNIMIGPGLENLDFSVFKNNYISRISENFNVQFRVEAFNILNRANFNAPGLTGKTNIYNASGQVNATAGQITSTVTDPREIQFALKLIW